MIFDEVYYGGDVFSWGDVICDVYGFVKWCFLLFGILFCSDMVLIFFVEYYFDEFGVWVLCIDYNYGYGCVFVDGVVCFVLFYMYVGKMCWCMSMGDEFEMYFG